MALPLLQLLNALGSPQKKSQGAALPLGNLLQSRLGAVELAVAVGVAYFLAARLGLALRAQVGVAIFWPAVGIATGVLIALGPAARLPVTIGVAVASMASGVLIGRNPWLAFTFVFLNLGEILLTAWLVQRWFTGLFKLEDVPHVLGFLVASAIAAGISGAGAAIAVTFLEPRPFSPDVLRIWFVAGLLGMVTVAPLLIGLRQAVREPPPRPELLEGTIALTILATLSIFFISLPQRPWATALPVAFVFSLLLWIAVRSRPVFTAAAMFVVTLTVVWSITFNIGHFGDASIPLADRILAAQTLVLVGVLLAFVLAALFAERRLAEQQLAKKSAALARLHEVGSRLWHKRDLRQALREILAGAIELLGADMGTIRLLDTQGVLKIEAHQGFKKELLDVFEVSAAGDSACGRALRSGKRMVIEDAERDTLFTPFHPLARAAGYRAMQSTPIMNLEGVPLGMLATHFQEVHKPTEQDLRLLDLYVRQAADIIERHKAEDALRESEERLRLAQLRTGVGVWDRDLRTGKLTWTPELEALFGLKHGTAKSYADFRAKVHPDDIGAFESAREAAVRRRETYKIEYRIIRPDGQVRWMLAMGGAFYDEATGEPIRLVGNNTDITERKLAELALAERNAQLALAGRAALVGSYAYDVETEAVQISEGYAAIFGFPAGTTNLMRSQWLARLHPEDREPAENLRNQAFRERWGEYNVDYRIIVPDRGVRWLEARTFISYDGNGRPRRVVGVNIDVTERKRAELALADRDTQLALAGKIGRVGSFAFDFGSRRIQVSPGYSAIYDLPESTVETNLRDWRARAHPDDVDRVELQIDEAIAARSGEYSLEYRIFRRSGEVRWIESRTAISYDKTDGTPERAAGVDIDVTERKQAELALADRNTQLALAGKAGLVATFVYDVKTERVQISEGYAAIYGFPEGTTEIARSQWRAMVLPDDLQRLDSVRSQAFADRRSEYALEYRIMLAERGVRWVETRSFISYDGERRPQRVVGVNIDITERKIAELALAERNAQLALAAKAAQVGCFVKDLKTGLITVSEGYAAIHELPEGTAQTTLSHWRSKVHPDDLPHCDKVRDQVLSNRERDYSFDYRTVRDGAIRWIESRGCVSYDEDGRAQQVIGINVDVTERKLNEARLSHALTAGQVVAFEWDAVTGQSKRSDSAEHIMGLAEGGSFWRQVHADDGANLKAHVRSLSPRNPAYALTFRFVRSDGRQVWLEETAKGEFDCAGTLLRIKGLTRDITERKQAELALTERNAQLAVAGQAGLVATFAYDAKTDRVQISEGYAAIYGFPEGTTEIARSQWRALVVSDDLVRLERIRSQAFADRQREYGLEYRIMLPDRGVRWIETRCFISYDGEGRPQRVVGVNIDVTERRRMEQTITDRNRQLELAGKAALVGSFAIDIDAAREDFTSHHMHFSPGFAAVYGLPEDTMEISVGDWRRLVHPDDLPKFLERLQQSYAERRGEHYAEFRIVRPCGTIRWIETRSYIEYDQADRARRLVGVNIDITERKRAEEARKLLNAELDHRVKNALATVTAVISYTRDGSRSVTDFIAALEGRIRSMAATHELLSSRRWQGISLTELVGCELEPYAARNNIEVGGPHVVLNPEAGQAIAMVLHELATNAAKYGALSNKNGRVSIRWNQRSNGSNLVLEWKEIGGPPVVETGKPGYGTSTICDLIPYEFGGTVDHTLNLEGARCRVELPAHWFSKDEPASEAIARASRRTADS